MSTRGPRSLSLFFLYLPSLLSLFPPLSNRAQKGGPLRRHKKRSPLFYLRYYAPYIYSSHSTPASKYPTTTTSLEIFAEPFVCRRSTPLSLSFSPLSYVEIPLPVPDASAFAVSRFFDPVRDVYTRRRFPGTSFCCPIPTLRLCSVALTCVVLSLSLSLSLVTIYYSLFRAHSLSASVRPDRLIRNFSSFGLMLRIARQYDFIRVYVYDSVCE